MSEFSLPPDDNFDYQNYHEGGDRADQPGSGEPIPGDDAPDFMPVVDPDLSEFSQPQADVRQDGGDLEQLYSEQFVRPDHPEVTDKDSEPISDTTKQSLLDKATLAASQGQYVGRMQPMGQPVSGEKYTNRGYDRQTGQHIDVTHYKDDDPRLIIPAAGGRCHALITVIDAPPAGRKLDAETEVGKTLFRINKLADGSLDVERHTEAGADTLAQVQKALAEGKLGELIKRSLEQNDDKLAAANQGRIFGFAFVSQTEAQDLIDQIERAFPLGE
jgi:hypothetical protein